MENTDKPRQKSLGEVQRQRFILIEIIERILRKSASILRIGTYIRQRRYSAYLEYYALDRRSAKVDSNYNSIINYILF